MLGLLLGVGLQNHSDCVALVGRRARQFDPSKERNTVLEFTCCFSNAAAIVFVVNVDPEISTKQGT